jgi:hypothetical protein
VPFPVLELYVPSAQKVPALAVVAKPVKRMAKAVIPIETFLATAFKFIVRLSRDFGPKSRTWTLILT